MVNLVKKIALIVRFYGIGFPKILGRLLLFWGARLAGRRVLTAKIYDTTLTVPVTSNGIGRGLYVYGARELDHKWMLERVLQPGDVIFDLGSNIGYYAVLQARLLQRQCRLFCVEPDPRNIDLLHRNIEEQGLSAITSVEQCAIADYEGLGRLVLENRTNLSRLADCTDPSSNAAPVRVYDFADYLKRIGTPVNVVRMDIEGGELRIFRSLLAARGRGEHVTLPRVIIFETHQYGPDAAAMGTLILGMFEAGYRPQYLASDDEASERPLLRSMGYWPRRIVHEPGVSRGIYDTVTPADAAAVISQWRGTRTVCLSIA